MKNGFLRICSMILVIVLLVNMLPLQVLAQEPDTGRVEQNQIEQIKPEEDVSAERVVEEIPQKRTEFSKEFLLENGLHKVNVYPEAVHYATEKGWEEIDNTLIIKADGTITNTAGVWDVSFPQQLSKDKSISIQKDGHTLSFYMAGEITSNGSALMRSADTAKETLSVASVKQSAAAIQTPPVQDSVLHEEKILQKMQSRLTYANVYNNTNVIYDLKSNKVKESVVLEAYNSALRGYRYILDVGTMIPVLEEDGRIVFYDANRENIVFVMPAPYMIDNGGACNYDVQVQLTGSGSRYTMTYTLPQQWLAAEDRAWPVILDPVVEPALTTTNIRDRTVVNQGSFSQTWGMNSCGRYSNGDITRTFLKYDNLPELTSSDVIVGATVHMYKPNASSTVTTVYAHKVLGTWASETISWSNKPAYNTTIEDYAIIQGIDWYCWDITDVVRGWYSDANTGVMFKAGDEIENGSAANFKEFYSSDYGSNKPVLSITFRNNNGLESYWDYTTASAGRAGTGYVNNYTGNLVWVRQDMGFGGNRMPVSISHVYNAADAYTVGDSNNSNDSAGNGFALGNGWRTNYNQLVYQWSEKSNYYVWEDADGTDHYFQQSASGEYKDEDGLELTLTTTGSGTEKYKITDKNGNISYFDSNGRLSKIQNNQQAKSSITITYESTSRRIKTITDGAGRKYYFEYTAGLLSAIRYMGHGMDELYCTTFEYEGNELICIYDNEAEYSEFEYWDRSILAAATDSQGYALRYYYYTLEDDLPSRVCEIHEVQDDYAIADMLTFEYEHNQTSVTEWLHENGGKTLTYQFNNMGNTICVQDNEGHAQYYKYAINGDETETEQSQPQNAKTNQLRLDSKLQNTVVNAIKESGFERGTVWSKTGGQPTVEIVSSQAYYGNHAMQIVTTQSGTGAYETNHTLNPGETVTFSAYVKTGSASASISVYNYTRQYESERLAPDTDWTRLEVTYTNNTSASQNICPHILTATPGSCWVDGVQLEYMSTASRYNLMDNGDFAYYNGGWSSNAGYWIYPSALPYMQDTTYRMAGSPTAQKRVSQTVTVNGVKGDSFILAGWAKGNAAPLWEKKEGENKREFAIRLQFHYTDNTPSKYFTAQFNPDSNQWQYSSVAAVAEKAYSSVTVEVVYDYNVNVVYFDGIQLFKEEFGTSYTYDENGNVESVTDLQKKKTTYEYDTNNNLTGIIESNGNRVSYTYDNYHNVLTATTVDRLVYHFTFDAYGNNTSVYTTVGGVTMATYADYTDDGNQLESATDALDKTTLYGYNEDTGLLEWVQNPEDTEDTRTNYAYDWLLRLEEVYAETDTGDNMSAYYYYDGDLISGILTYGAEYSFNRGDFELVSSVRAGDYFLAGYEYTDDGNYFLYALDYGNGGCVRYTYDDKGRVIKESFESGDETTYAYNNDGQLAVVTDSGITTKYYYDLIGRMVKQVETGGGRNHTVQYTYNEVNNLASLQETINGITHTDIYAYDAYDRVESVTNSAVSEHYHYDDFGRVNQSVTKDGDASVLTESYTFTAPSANTTSGQIATNRLQANGYDVTYSYTYDGNGNILSISDGTYTTSYVYDSANQLLRENNQAGGFTHTWEYDPAGNILNRKEYAYTTGVLGTPIDTVTYSYDDYTWGDLLTAYDGQTIYCDEIGNPIFDGTWDYCWNAGRELCVMIFNGEDGYYLLWEFTYDVNGMRTKRSCEDGTIYQYVYNGSSLSQMTVGTNTLYFAYGANGVPMSVTYNNVTYYYVVNIQGDIIAILNAARTPVVHYSYDAWGNPISTTGSMASTLGTLNPLRYRGYVYDQETGLYYLQSRYYNPEWGRFINADVVFDYDAGIQGHNLFIYCGNNPCNRIDASGADSFGLQDLDLVNDVLSEKDGGRSFGNQSITSSTGGSNSFAMLKQTFRSAINGLNMATGQKPNTYTEEHHILSNKNSKYSPQYQEIMDRYDMTLNAKENIISLSGHRGRHTNAYNETMLYLLRATDDYANGNQVLFQKGFGMIRQTIIDNPWIPYARYK